MNNDYPYATNPYNIDPLSFIAQSMQQGQPMQQPSFPQMAPEQKSFGPAHDMLQDYFRQALMRQMAVPGLLNSMQQNPQMAQSVGGLLTNSFTPQATNPYHIDWAKAEATAKAMPTGYASDAAPVRGGSSD